MEMKVKKSKSCAEIEFTDSTPSFANALRRIMISEIPLNAIEEVNITENNSALQDEMLSHRLGLIPVKGEGSFKLKVEGPLTVMSANMQPIDGNVSIENLEIPIVELLENQRLDLTCKTQTGTGKEHAKWQAAVVSYEYKNPSKIKLCVESCSTLPEEEIIKRGLVILKNKVQEFKDSVSKYKSI
ncbi:MAG: DNA-directed RNA polymerase subunit D [Candidatus Aenigmarchaeota archaeon]|nr:DNA-directed RNA polymerase subunit D [Candidatus Aenigmarchaeota archaeon]